MTAPKDRLIVALDVPSVDEARALLAGDVDPLTRLRLYAALAEYDMPALGEAGPAVSDARP